MYTVKDLQETSNFALVHFWNGEKWRLDKIYRFGGNKQRITGEILNLVRGKSWVYKTSA
jgi:hypothetical protein